MVVEYPVTSNIVEQDILLILSIFGYLHPEIEKAVRLNPVFPRSDDIIEYIKNKRKKIIKDTHENRIKRTSIKARVNRENFRRIKQGEYVSPLAAFYFFGDEITEIADRHEQLRQPTEEPPPRRARVRR
jgi:hypothetical protein